MIGQLALGKLVLTNLHLAKDQILNSLSEPRDMRYVWERGLVWFISGKWMAGDYLLQLHKWSSLEQSGVAVRMWLEVLDI